MTAPLESLDLAFAWLLRATVQASIVVALLLMARLALRDRVAPGARYALWALLALPLFAPLLPAGPFRIPAQKPVAREVSHVQPPAWRVEYEPLGVPVTAIAGTHDATRPARSIPWLRIGAIAWLVGATALSLRVAVSHTRAVLHARRSPPVTDPFVGSALDECRAIVRTRRTPQLVAASGAGPALLGVMRPRLLLPASLVRRLSPAELRFVFLHELVHLKRGDVLAEWLLTLLQVAHWFNPLVWLAASRCRADREVACDAAVLALAGESRRADYGRTILRLATELSPRPRLSAAVGILETHSPLERRLRMIAVAPDRKFARWPVAGVVVLALAAVTCTNARQEPPSKTAEPQATAPQRPASPATAPASKGWPGPQTRDVAVEEWKVKEVSVERVDPQTAARNQKVMQQLERPLPEINFDKVGFTDAVDFLRDVSGANIFVNWRALENAKLDRNSPVTARMRDIKLSKALAIILDSLGGDTVKLGYTVDDGVITISTDDDLARNTITSVYDIRDLIIPIPDFDPKDIPPAAGGAAEAGGKERTRQENIDEIVRLITETVSPQSWRDAGGSVGSVRELQGQLIITATPEMHDSIAQLIRQLREAGGMQINVEARFIGVDDDVIDALPARLRDAVAGALRGSKDPAPAADAPGPADGQAVKEANAAQALYLDKAQVDELLKAVQASRTSTIVSAPRITLFNGQRAYVQTGSQRAYVADYKIVKQPDGKTTYEPQLGTAEAGVLLRARATVSADRRFATLSLHPRLTYLAGIEDIPWHQSPKDEEMKVQRPKLLVSELGFTASVPNASTLLLGGLKGHTGPEGNHDASRLQNIILLVKPTIIIQREIEKKQFPVKSEKTDKPQ